MIVFGHTGFIGRSFVRYLERRGIPFTAASSNTCDLTDPESAGRFLDAAETAVGVPLRVVMLSVIGKFVDNTEGGYEKNIRMVENLIQGLDGRNCAALVFAGSTEVYGRPVALPLTEDTPVRPVDWYGRAKLAAEQMFLKAVGLAPRCSLLRLPGIYGLTEDGPSVVDRLYQRVLAEEGITLYGKGTSLRDFVCVDDLNRLMEELAMRDHGAGVLNVASGETISMGDLVAAIEAAAGKTVNRTYEPEDADRGFDLVFDISKLRRTCPGAIPRSVRAHLEALRKDSTMRN